VNRSDLEGNWAFASNQGFAAVIIVVDVVGENADRRAVGLVPDGEAVVVFNQSGAIKTVGNLSGSFELNPKLQTSTLVWFDVAVSSHR
jgi:hypothetical protein